MLPRAVLLVGHVGDFSRFRLIDRIVNLAAISLLFFGRRRLAVMAAIDCTLVLPVVLKMALLACFWVIMVSLVIIIIIIIVALTMMRIVIVVFSRHELDMMLLMFTLLVPLVGLPLSVRIRLLVVIVLFLVSMKFLIAAPSKLSFSMAVG